MDKKKIITIVSITITIFIIAIAAVLIIHKNNSTAKTVIVGKNIKDEETQEPIESLTEESPEESMEPTLSPSPKSSPTPKSSPKPSVPTGKYYIKVNNQANTVTIYTKDKDGNYTVPVKAMVCSTGGSTPRNSKYTLKGKWNWGPLFGGVYGQYISQINGDILFHSVPYLKRYDHNSLEYWEYDKLGTTCSAGCVRLTVADSMWIYYNCPPGTGVEFYSSSNPGPLGKPSAMKISSYTEYRGWDPTDPNSNSPWKNFKPNTPETPIEPTTEPTVEPIPTPTVKPTQPQTTPSSEIKIPVVTPSSIPTIDITLPTESGKLETAFEENTPVLSASK